MEKHFPEKKLIAFIDDELNESEYNLIQAHLKTCGQCAKYVDQMRTIYRGLNEFEDVPDNYDLISKTIHSWRILKQSNETSGRILMGSKLRRIHRFLTAGAVAAGLTLGFFFGDMARQGLINEYNTEQNGTVVLQKNNQTINDTYVSLIINDGREDI